MIKTCNVIIFGTFFFFLSIIVSFANNSVVVIPLGSDNSVAGQQCPPGMFVTGFDTSSKIICNYPSKRIFVTPGTYPGNLNSLEGADGICQSEADHNGLGGTYKAWLSDVDSGPSSNFVRYRGDYITPTGIVVAHGWDDLTDGTLLNPINITSQSEEFITYVWTNTQVGGNIDTYDTHCANWTSNDASAAGMVGHSNWIDSHWSEYRALSCSQALAIYCVEQ